MTGHGSVVDGMFGRLKQAPICSVLVDNLPRSSIHFNPDKRVLHHRRAKNTESSPSRHQVELQHLIQVALKV